MVSLCNPGSVQTHCTGQVDLELVIFQLQLPKNWDYRCMSPYPDKRVNLMSIEYSLHNWAFQKITIVQQRKLEMCEVYSLENVDHK
jgi:hypothetical protein